MSRLLQLCAVAAALPLMGFQPACTPPPAVELMKAPQGQEEDAWCWAAAGAMAMNYLHQVPKPQQVQQCQEVDKLHVKDHPTADPHQCCNNPQSCSTQRGYPDYSDFKGFSAVPHTKLTWEQLTALVGCQGKPVPYVRTRGSSQHMLVVVGYYTDDQGVRYLYVNDPMPIGKGTLSPITFEEYRKHSVTQNDDVTYAP